MEIKIVTDKTTQCSNCLSWNNEPQCTSFARCHPVKKQRFYNIRVGGIEFVLCKDCMATLQTNICCEFLKGE